MPDSLTGRTVDSDSISLGSNPSRAAITLEALEDNNAIYRFLVEGNDWVDKYWGCFYNPENFTFYGKNILGQILMQIRKEIHELPT